MAFRNNWVRCWAKILIVKLKVIFCIGWGGVGVCVGGRWVLLHEEKDILVTENLL